MPLAADFHIRTMNRDDVDVALEWAAAEGWNPGLDDARSFWAADPSGFFVAESKGEPIAAVSAVAYDAQFGFVGLYIVRPDFRNRWIGPKLADVALAYLGDRIIGCDGVVEQVESYRKLWNFELITQNIRFEGTGGGTRPGEVVDLADVPFEEVMRYDRLCFPAERSAFLERWIDRPKGGAVGVPRDGQLAGYGVIRACRQGWKIGPLFADDASIAESLLESLLSTIPGELYYWDIAGLNAEAKAMAAARQLTKVFETARMYKNGRPQVDDAKVFGVTTFELG
ncbi:hypothetical protein Pan216_13420 [Planctomycetes bacterium Pan216]|uniref:N-acetyltransferase domain-containing protein n=1 Tax=Kolteria novifilia TaxID=2527975 RepID=A0A518B0K1_9BACT|nr:hypothetical protein Pan216_13420 [Planctomycetes bacterium Pan216]